MVYDTAEYYSAIKRNKSADAGYNIEGPWKYYALHGKNVSTKDHVK